MPDIKLLMQTSDSKHKRKTREGQGKNKGRTVGSVRLQRLAATADGKRTSAGGPAQTPAQTATGSRQQAADGVHGIRRDSGLSFGAWLGGRTRRASYDMSGTLNEECVLLAACMPRALLCPSHTPIEYAASLSSGPVSPCPRVQFCLTSPKLALRAVPNILDPQVTVRYATGKTCPC